MLVYTSDVYPKLLSIREQTHEFIIYEMRQQARADNLTIIIVKKQIDVSCSCLCPVIDQFAVIVNLLYFLRPVSPDRAV